MAFKPGQEVFYFKHHAPVVLEKFEGKFCVGFWLDNRKYSFTKEGYEFERDTVPSIYPATKETQKRLRELTGYTFLEPMELQGYDAIVNALKTQESVKCLVGDYGYPTNERVVEVIRVAGHRAEAVYFDSMGYAWDWAELVV